MNDSGENIKFTEHLENDAKNSQDRTNGSEQKAMDDSVQTAGVLTIQPEEFQNDKPEPQDASAQISVASDGMIAYLTVVAPQNGGEDITEDRILEELRKVKIIFGVDEQLLHDIEEQKIYADNLVIAKGQPAVDGIDGTVEEFFPREKRVGFTEAEDGSVDFKNLHSFIVVEKDTVICRKKSATKAQPGCDVYGRKVDGMDGREAYLYAGSNTALSSDGTELRSVVYGSLEFKGDKFNVTNTYKINGNVDNSVGNIDFPGDVIVSGDVCEGYSIKAYGNVVVRGSVEGASIYANGNIELANGINGMQKGILNSNANIKSMYIENCTASAKGNIQVESIINSQISCGGKLIVQGRRGAIIGGACSVVQGIEAREIGTKNHTATILVLGITSEVIKERSDTEAQLKKLEREAEDVTLNINYLEEQMKKQQLPEKKAEVLTLMRRKLPVNLLTQSRLRKKLSNIEDQINRAQNCTVRCAYIYPPTKITFGNITTVIQSENQRCVFSCDNGEIVCKPY